MDSLSLDPAALGRTGVRKTIWHLRLGFAGMTLLIVCIGAVLAWRSWRAEKEHELLYLSSLVDINGQSLDGYFAGHARMLQHLGADILATRAPLVSKDTRALLTHARQNNPDLLHVNLILSNGQMVMADDVPLGQPLPYVGGSDSFRLALDNMMVGRDFDIGRVLPAGHGGDWMIPLRLGVRDGQGQLAFILSATLPVNRQQVFWQGVPLPRESALGLLRDDGYLVSRFPVPKAIDHAEAYGKPRSGQLREYLQQNHFPMRGVTEGYNSVSKADYLFAFHRLSSYPMTMFVSTPVSNVQTKWLNQAQFSLVLLSCLLLGGLWRVPMVESALAGVGC